MKKKFYKYAIWTVIGSSLVNILFSLLYYIANEASASESAMLVTLYYLQLAFGLISAFVGFGTIIYAAARFSWLDSLAMGGIYFCSVLLLSIYQTVTTSIYYSNVANANALGYSENVVDLVSFSAFYSLGQLFITFMIPAAIIVFMCYKRIKKGETKFERFVSFKNPTQKTMGIFCIVMACINMLSFLLIDVLAFLVEYEFYITSSEFFDIITSSLLMLLENSIYYIIVQYIVFMLVFKLYNYLLDNGGAQSFNKTNNKK